jgi:hypothetical protein
MGDRFGATHAQWIARQTMLQSSATAGLCTYFFVNLSNLIIAVVIARGFAAARAGRLQTFNGLQYREAFRSAGNVWRRRWSSLRVRRQLVTGLLLQHPVRNF